VGRAGLCEGASEGPECQNRESIAVDGELRDGLEELSEGLEELSEGLEELSEGLEELSDGLRELMDGRELLTDGLELLKGGLEKQRNILGGPTDGSSWPSNAMAIPHPKSQRAGRHAHGSAGPCLIPSRVSDRGHPKLWPRHPVLSYLRTLRSVLSPASLRSNRLGA